MEETYEELIAITKAVKAIPHIKIDSKYLPYIKGMLRLLDKDMKRLKSHR
tara:strand:- start:1315 stop:1464 length:150 start_codon:yes stop_codon:yes gene_type:complete